MGSSRSMCCLCTLVFFEIYVLCEYMYIYIDIKKTPSHTSNAQFLYQLKIYTGHVDFGHVCWSSLVLQASQVECYEVA